MNEESVQGKRVPRLERAPLQILALSTLVIAQPLYELFAAHADYFTIRDLGAVEILAATLALFALPPLGLFVAAALLDRLAERFGAVGAATSAVLGLLAAAGLLLALRPLGWPWPLVQVAAAGAVGAGFAVLHRRHPAPRQILGLVALLAPVAPLLFLLHPNVRPAVFLEHALPDVPEAAVRAPAPVVVVVLDELPVGTLLDPNGAIDRNLFPHLAGFADTATWYRGAVTPYYFTQLALPAITAGIVPEDTDLATTASYPRTLFTLLRHSHDIVSDEPMTSLDPSGSDSQAPERWATLAVDAATVYLHAVVPRRWRGRLPDPTTRWLGVGEGRGGGSASGRAQRFRDLVGRLGEHGEHGELGEDSEHDPETRPPLVFAHVLLPHHPWTYGPAGQIYDPGDELFAGPLAEGHGDAFGLLEARWADDWDLVLGAYQRHVLQTVFADRLVGELLAELRRLDLFDEALVVVTADHGIHFEPGEPARQVTAGNVESLARVPLLVKLPGQRSGTIDDSPRSTVDILPTVAEVLEVDQDLLARRGWTFDGASLLGPAPERERPELPAFKELRRRWYLRLAGAPDPVHIGPHAERLLGGVVPRGRASRDWIATIDRDERFDRVDPATSPPPLYVAGRLLPRSDLARRILADDGTLSDEGTSFEIALAVDGVLRATTRGVVAGEEVRFSCLLPRSALPDGSANLGVFLIRQEGEALELVPIPRARVPRWELAEPAPGRTILRRPEARRVAKESTEERTEEIEVSGPPAGDAVALTVPVFERRAEVFGRVAPGIFDEANGPVEIVAFVGGRFAGRTVVEELTEEPADDRTNDPHRSRYLVEEPGAFHLLLGLPRAVVQAEDAQIRLFAIAGERRAAEIPVRSRPYVQWRFTGPFELYPETAFEPVHQNY